MREETREREGESQANWFFQLAVAVAAVAVASHLLFVSPNNLPKKQKRQLLHEQAVKAAAKITDPFRCVERLVGASGPEIRRLAAKDSASTAMAAAAAAGASLAPPPLGSSSSASSSSSAGAAASTCTLRLGKLIVGGVLVDEPLQVDLKALAAALPSHAVACLLSGGDSFGEDDEEEEIEKKEEGSETAAKNGEPVPLLPPSSPVPLPAPGASASRRGPPSAFARWAAGLTSARVSASCSAEHAARALRLLAAIVHAADASPGVFAGLAEVTDDGAVVAFDAGGRGAGADGPATPRHIDQQLLLLPPR